MSEIIVDNPATGETAVTVPTISAEEARGVAESASVGARELRACTVAERVDLCERAVQAMEGRSQQIAREISLQMGKPISEARGELRVMAERARHMMDIAEACLADIELAPKAGFERRIERVPVGVVLNVSAWNYPLLIAVNCVVPALLAGNSVLIKHSRRTPLCAGHFADAFAAAGAPEGSMIAVVADHAATAAIISRPEVGYVAFTGSVEGGREISRAAAGRFIDVGLELGGKDPAYVRADADLQAAAEGLAEGSFYNAGQSCCAVERIYVDRSIYGDFIDAITEAAGRWQPGDPLDDSTTLGPMAQASATATLTAQLEEAVAKGARITCGGNPTSLAGRGRYFEPTVVADASHDMEVMLEESFGPIVAIAPVDSDEEGLAMMNDSRYGLTASIWTRDVDVARGLARGVEAGTVLMNRCDVLDPALPWSGWKDSGVGVSLSQLGFDRMTRTRAHHFKLAGA